MATRRLGGSSFNRILGIFNHTVGCAIKICKIASSVMVVCVVLFAGSGCSPKPDIYLYPNRAVKIDSIEIVLNLNEDHLGTDETKFQVLSELEAEAFDTYIERIQKVETACRYGGPLWGYGKVFTRVTYINGDIEILGINNIEFISAEESATGFGSYYYIDKNQLISIMSEYADLSEYLQGD